MQLKTIGKYVVYALCYWIILLPLTAIVLSIPYIFGNHNYLGKIFVLYGVNKSFLEGSLYTLLIIFGFVVFNFLIKISKRLLLRIKFVPKLGTNVKIPIVFTIVTLVFFILLFLLEAFVVIPVFSFLIELILYKIYLPYNPKPEDVSLLSFSLALVLFYSLLFVIIFYFAHIKNIIKTENYLAIKKAIFTLILLLGTTFLHSIVFTKQLVWEESRFSDAKSTIGVVNQYSVFNYYNRHLSCDLWKRNSFENRIYATSLAEGAILSSYTPIYFINNDNKLRVNIKLLEYPNQSDPFEIVYIAAPNRRPWGGVYIYEPNPRIYPYEYPFSSLEDRVNEVDLVKFILNDQIVNKSGLHEYLKSYKNLYPFTLGNYKLEITYTEEGGDCKGTKLINFSVKE